MASPSLTPFTVKVPDHELRLLKNKLEAATFPDEVDEASWDYGVPLSEIQRLVNHWNSAFDWRRQEARINELPQFKTGVNVDGFDDVEIHFLHQKSAEQHAVPLLFVHGWPGHFLEVSKMLPHLGSVNDDGPVFDVVAPSLPNFGFSPSIRRKGFALKQYAELCHKLMLQLGYSEYVTQGGDWGYMITRAIGYLYPLSCKASHVNMLPLRAPSWMTHPLLSLQATIQQLSLRDQQALQHTQNFQSQGSGYGVLQATKPQTLGYAMADSPVALLAWLYEKLHDWTDDYPWMDDEILTWVSIYWFSTAGPAASCRIYYECAHDTFFPNDIIRYGAVPQVKYGVSFFPKEVLTCPKLWVQQMGNIVYRSEATRGGHFAAWENPKHIVQDLRTMFGRGGPAFGCVRDRIGYSMQ